MSIDFSDQLKSSSQWRGDYGKLRYQIFSHIYQNLGSGDDEEDESWLLWHRENGNYILLHRYIPLALSSKALSCYINIFADKGLEVIITDEFNSLDLEITENTLFNSRLDWHTSILPEEGGINLKSFSASDLYYATV